MNEARPFMYARETGVKELPAPAASAKSDYQPDDRSTWEHAHDAGHQAYRKAHDRLPSVWLGQAAFSPPAIRAASPRISGSLYSAAHSLTDPDCQGDQSRSSLAHPTVETLPTRWKVKKNASILRRSGTANKRFNQPLFFRPDLGRIVRMWTRTTEADSRKSACIWCALPISNPINLPVHRTSARMEKVSER
jgi:hypothetical protein